MKSLMPLLLSTAFCFKSSVKKEIAGIFNKYFCLISPQYEPLVHIGICSIHIELFFFHPIMEQYHNSRGYFNQSETIMPSSGYFNQ